MGRRPRRAPDGSGMGGLDRMGMTRAGAVAVAVALVAGGGLAPVAGLADQSAQYVSVPGDFGTADLAGYNLGGAGFPVFSGDHLTVTVADDHQQGVYAQLLFYQSATLGTQVGPVYDVCDGV